VVQGNSLSLYLRAEKERGKGGGFLTFTKEGRGGQREKKVF